jgi:diacylglycerol kinase
MIVHVAAAIAVLVVNILLKISQTEWLITLILIGLAWMAEFFNTAVEKLADRVTKEQDPLIGQVKDLASGAVLIICFFAVVCAVIIYLPYLLKLKY